MTSLGMMKAIRPMMQESKPYWICNIKSNFPGLILLCELKDGSRLAISEDNLTQIQKKTAISKEFWNRMTWMSKRTRRGLLNQKWWSEGLTTKSPSMATCLSATSWAIWLITCSSLVPTASRSWKQRKTETEHQLHFFTCNVYLVSIR